MSLVEGPQRHNTRWTRQLFPLSALWLAPVVCLGRPACSLNTTDIQVDGCCLLIIRSVSRSVRPSVCVCVCLSVRRPMIPIERVLEGPRLGSIFHSNLLSGSLEQVAGPTAGRLNGIGHFCGQFKLAKFCQDEPGKKANSFGNKTNQTMRIRSSEEGET